MLHSPSRSSTSRALGLAVAGAAAISGCSDDPCGPGGAPDVGVVASGDAVTLTYGRLTGGLNNDCPASDAPAGVVSMTIHGTQTDGTGQLTLCLGRPDLLTHQALALGHDVASAPVRIIDITGAASACSFTVDRAQPPTGTASSSGLCGNGKSASGFALTLDGTVSLTRTCGATIDSVKVTLHGRVAVAAQ